MIDKPTSCTGCILEKSGKGFSYPVGPVDAKILFLTENLGDIGAYRGEALSGDGGGFFNKVLSFAKVQRTASRVYSAIACNPPGGNWFQEKAAAHCKQHLDPVLNEQHKVVVPMGELAIRQVLQLGPDVKVKDLNFHGTVQRDPFDRFWVVPTFDPVIVQRGKRELTGVMTWDIQRAVQVAESGWDSDEPELVVDPPIGYVERFIEDLKSEILARGAENVWLAADIETPDKEAQDDEGELGVDDVSYIITRINFAFNTGLGLTFPWVGRYIELATEILGLPCVKIFHNKHYDLPRIRDKGIVIAGPIWDSMDAWHALQTRLPKGLGFVAPFYCHARAWKHLSGSDPGTYAAYDPVKTLRCMFGIARELQAEGRWNIFYRHMYLCDTYVLHPAEEVGLEINREELTEFRSRLGKAEVEFWERVQKLVPESCFELVGGTGNEGWKRPPTLSDLQELNATRIKNDKPLLKIPEDLGAISETKEKISIGDIRIVDDWDIPGIDDLDAINAEFANPSNIPNIDLSQHVVPFLLSKQVKLLVQVCKKCGGVEVGKAQLCPDRLQKHEIEVQEKTVTRYFVKEEFNPGSSAQILAYIKYRKHKPGFNRKTKQESADKNTLERLFKADIKAGIDPERSVYRITLDYREVTKVKSTYADATEERISKSLDGRLHGHFSHRPFTLRLASYDPNLQNVVGDKE